jgi:hypothetical protein
MSQRSPSTSATTRSRKRKEKLVVKGPVSEELK